MPRLENLGNGLSEQTLTLEHLLSGGADERDPQGAIEVAKWLGHVGRRRQTLGVAGCGSEEENREQR